MDSKVYYKEKKYIGNKQGSFKERELTKEYQKEKYNKVLDFSQGTRKEKAITIYFFERENIRNYNTLCEYFSKIRIAYPSINKNHKNI